MRNIVPLLLVLLAACCISKPVALSGVEVRDYRGERLSSVQDFRENSIKGPQDVDIQNYSLKISGLVENPRELAYGEVLAHRKYEKVVTLFCVEGWNAKILWEGFLLTDLFGETLPGANTVIFRSVDGYSTSLPLDYVRDRQIMLAYRMNNVTLPPERGFPFQVVAEDRWGYKWAKWVNEIEISDDAGFKGYWESRGYDAGGNLSAT